MTLPTSSHALPLALALALAACGSRDARDAATARKHATAPDPAGAPADARSPAAGSNETATSLAAGDTVILYPAAELARIAAGLGHGPTGRTLGAAPGYSYIEGRRTESGGPEVHDHWTDIAYVQAGHATLLTGGRLEGSREAPSGEHRGGTIVGGSSRTIAAGDLYVIPAGTPHQYRLAPGESLTYLTIKAPGTAPR